MKISERTVKRLGEIITGDKGIAPYRGGPKSLRDEREQGFREFSHRQKSGKQLIRG